MTTNLGNIPSFESAPTMWFLDIVGLIMKSATVKQAIAPQTPTHLGHITVVKGPPSVGLLDVVSLVCDEGLNRVEVQPSCTPLHSPGRPVL